MPKQTMTGVLELSDKDCKADIIKNTFVNNEEQAWST